MPKDLTNSFIDRKNILNNNSAIQELYEQTAFSGVLFEGEYRYTKQQISRYFEIDVRTIERLLEANEEELRENGYELFKGVRLKDLKTAFSGSAIIANEQINSKTPSIGIFTFKSFLNIGMLLKDSEKARELRSDILNIVIDILNKKNGGVSRHIYQREETFLPSVSEEYIFTEPFTNALDQYVEGNKLKYAQFADKIYSSIFKEHAKNYKHILSLGNKENNRKTNYSDVHDLVAIYENGFSEFLKRLYVVNGRKLKLSEAHLIFREFEEITNTLYEPLREKARALMASRDMSFRDVLHEKLKNYINAVNIEDFENFLDEKSRTLEARMEENKDVFQRLKDR